MANYRVDMLGAAYGLYTLLVTNGTTRRFFDVSCALPWGENQNRDPQPPQWGNRKCCMLIAMFYLIKVMFKIPIIRLYGLEMAFHH